MHVKGFIIIPKLLLNPFHIQPFIFSKVFLSKYEANGITNGLHLY
jgi:hypothetical protein